jgi:anti-anti-sigma factor
MPRPSREVALMIPFALSEREIWPACREIAIEGELDLAVSERLRVVLDRAVAERQHVLIDLSRCDFLDVRALAVLIQADRDLRAHGRQLLLQGAHGQVRRLLSKTAAPEAGLPSKPMPRAFLRRMTEEGVAAGTDR